MKKIFGYISIVLFFMSCSDTGETFKETSEGLVYAYRIDNLQSPKPKNGDRLLLKVAYYNESDSLLFDSREISHRFVQEYIEPQDTTPSIYHIYQMLSQGDSITAKINAEHFFEVHRKDGLPPGIQQGEMLRFEVKLDSIFSPEEFISHAEKIIEDLCEQEQLLLAEYIAGNYSDIEPTQSGMYYIEEQQGDGKKPTNQSIVTIHYTAAYITGDIIYSSAKVQKPLTFSVQDEKVWPGLCEGVQYMRKGGYAKFVLPSDLAAGKDGEDPIPPCKTIVLKVALLEVE
ncbi:MAG: FKBP-type peptidyl-prolyl cis-trans isomerase [Bacteroidales bacterium]|nr:FKBP-type peptidyl-prolyl cis-trans isomerase [Bacteroidales bacterium]